MATVMMAAVAAAWLCLATAWFGERWSAGLMDEAVTVYGSSVQRPRLRWVQPWFVMWFVGTAIGLMVIFEGRPLALLAWLVWLVMLGLLGLIDARTGLLPNELTLAMMIGGLAWQGALSHSWLPPAGYAWGMVIGWALPFSLNALYERCHGALALGEGDAKLLAGLGAWLGLEALPVVWIVACVAVLVYTAVVSVVDGHRPSHVTFGPFLAMGASGVVFLNHV